MPGYETLLFLQNQQEDLEGVTVLKKLCSVPVDVSLLKVTCLGIIIFERNTGILGKTERSVLAILRHSGEFLTWNPQAPMML